MKKIHFASVLFTMLLILSGCSHIEDTVDALDSVSCANSLSRLNDNDDLSCSETIKELEKIERDCSAYLNANSKANIALLKANCQDD